MSHSSDPGPFLEPTIECRCSGDAREMGLAQGRILKRKIFGARDSLRQLEALRIEQPWWLPYSLFMKAAERKCSAFTAALARSNPSMLARLKGIAEGAGLRLGSLCLMNSMEAFIGSLEGRTIVPPLGACSALAVRGARSRSGEPVIARNFDYPPLFQPFFTVRESHLRGGFRSLDFLAAPQAGTIDGVNEKGLVVTMNYAFVTDRGSPNQVLSMLIADVLASCASVADALERITTAPHWGAAILMLADASGDIASVELSNSRSAVRRPAPGSDWLLVTNVCVCPEICAVQADPAAVYSSKAPLSLRGRSVLEPHKNRAQRFEELLRLYPMLGPDELAAVMSDHGPSGVPDGNSPCVHTPYFNTTATMQWFPASRRVRISFSPACAARFAELTL